VLSNAAVTNGAGNIDIITDYTAGEIIDVTEILSVTTATNVHIRGLRIGMPLLISRSLRRPQAPSSSHPSGAAA